MFKRLEASKIVDTVTRLEKRIGERFPKSSLRNLVKELSETAGEAQQTTDWIARPNMALRAVSIILCVVVVVSIIVLEWQLTDGVSSSLPFRDSLELLNSLLGIMFFVGGIVFFLISLEDRFKRRRALQAIHELRVLAHIVDMHQLTKDPERMTQSGPDTPSSPKRSMTPFELGRYFDYCSESLSLISKLSALYVQDFADTVVVNAVDEIESLTTGLSRKIWQKIDILDQKGISGSRPRGGAKPEAKSPFRTPPQERKKPAKAAGSERADDGKGGKSSSGRSPRRRRRPRDPNRPAQGGRGGGEGRRGGGRRRGPAKGETAEKSTTAPPDENFKPIEPPKPPPKPPAPKTPDTTPAESNFPPEL